MTFFTTIALLASAQGFFLGLVLIFIRRGHLISNRYLGLLIIVYSAWTAEFASYFTELLFGFPHLLFLTINVPLLFGPLLYFYAKSLESYKWKRGSSLLHFIPFLVFISLQFPFLLSSANDKIEVLRALRNVENPPVYSMEFFLREGFKSLHLLAYIWISRGVFSHMKEAKQTSIQQKTRNRWLLILMIGLGCYAIFDIAHFLGLYLFAYDYLFLIAKGVLLSGATVIYYIGYQTIRRPLTIEVSYPKEIPVFKTKYAKSGLNTTQAMQMLQKIKSEMDVQKPYLDPNLSLQSLAVVIGISTHHLSQVINTQLGKSFSEYITEYRIETAKEKLADPSNDHYTILSIAYDSGFRNKASFNNAFKKMTGLTPSAFRSNQSQLTDPN